MVFADWRVLSNCLEVDGVLMMIKNRALFEYNIKEQKEKIDNNYDGAFGLPADAVAVGSHSIAIGSNAVVISGPKVRFIGDSAAYIENWELEEADEGIVRFNEKTQMKEIFYDGDWIELA